MTSPGASLRFLKKSFRPSEKGFRQQPEKKGPRAHALGPLPILDRRYWSFYLPDRPETRPEIELHHWNLESLLWPVTGKERPDLIFFDPPYFKKQENYYPEESISTLSRKEYLKFFKELFPMYKGRERSIHPLPHCLAAYGSLIEIALPFTKRSGSCRIDGTQKPFLCNAALP